MSVNKVVILTTILFGLSYLDVSATDLEPDYKLGPENRNSVLTGKKIYTSQCAACHGVQLEGQPNWRQRKPNGKLPAPPHNASGHTWHHPTAMLFAMTKYGPGALIQNPAYKTDMPAYNNVLSDEEILAVLSYIKSQWPIEVRERHDRIDERYNQN
ncbi:cytochrome c [Kordiimonas sp. SCSIO 12603]|uniref:c-type cytochrome n=1 Tax=Kordiimonas sp. SCSIO 12603 TaxID=2829596 RepID=UPI0021061E2F|nr:cytochrome c [Kordiimonas sp. SCSIO 12603]UTW59477.1 cytochrome c [Kordiimonas sp. SCSIO 12603]